MSVERLFFSKSGGVYRLGEGIQPGEVSLVYDELNNDEPFILAVCAEQDEGGVALAVQADEMVGSLDGNLGIPESTMDKLRAIKPVTGVLFKERVKLIDGDEGLIVIQHVDTDQTRAN